jgi:hypothetical protein
MMLLNHNIPPWSPRNFSFYLHYWF